MKRIFIATVLIFTTSVIAAQPSMDRESIKKRITPVGKVFIEDISIEAEAVEDVMPMRSGKIVYNQFCVACHASGAANAPILGDAEAWKPRIAKGNEVLYKNVINGYKVMPAKGGCMDCSDEELKASVDFMIKN